ncbi:hypothetical protein J1N35_037915 [Gossypium stocksii]|uniref:Uncharacterized protein n=1 Tax=Gossypium stocksii TaxID=47602 RepID=A0A9D3ZLD4_9ROSI|nr:hypothetical protein J1N35_037915 [Gossypium stocksii]
MVDQGLSKGDESIFSDFHVKTMAKGKGRSRIVPTRDDGGFGVAPPKRAVKEWGVVVGPTVEDSSACSNMKLAMHIKPCNRSRITCSHCYLVVF